ncbi:PEP-CTERM sorting domain-containing protein [Microcoleus sp. OTE_8_concoct_300]|uniref:PEP-CTERM sorting domain-containing protein n=1 Tax=Microcoleus sp. OTE_8_concoct_300 TaxID=2964710 RepID=UPI00403F6667
MKLNHSTGAIAFLLATPLVTGLTVGIAPSSAAILAGSAAAVSINNFSHRPNDTGTVTNTYTPTIANSGSVISETTADKVFLSNSHELLAANLSQSKVQGDGNNYSGFAQIQAAVIGDFAIDAAETFSFSFQTVLDLLISVDNRQSERGSTSGSISFSLINTVTNILLDSFQLTSALDSYSGLYLDFSASNSFNSTPLNFNSMAEGSAVQSLLSTSGVYSRTFDSATNLRLVEVKNNIAEAEAVPEPSTLLGTAIFLGLFVRRRKLNNKFSQVTSKV